MALPYYKINKFLWKWTRREGADGCEIVREATLSMDKVPPPLAASPRKPEPSKPPTRRLTHADRVNNSLDSLASAVESLWRFKKWLNTPPPPKEPKPAPVAKQDREQATAPFDIQEIPAAMRKIYLPKSAALMDRWFAGRLNYSPTDGDEIAEINQDGKPYPPDMYDTTTIKLDWVLQFPRAKEKYDYLINEGIRSPKAIRELYVKLAAYKDKGTHLFASDICGDDPASLHRHFQFQRVAVDGTFAQKINLLLTSAWERSGAPDDLTGALGSFVIYAAIGHVWFSWDVESRRTIAEVMGVRVYVKDHYTFTDKQGDRSQYLGHWSSDGVIVIPLDALAATSAYLPYAKSSITLPYIDTPVAVGKPTIKGNVYYPVHNSDFRQWASRHQRGGDFIVYSDRRFVPLDPPIKIYL
ncbi:hypothetical protein LIG30_1075 [Burkholderia sp. lig30]|uniref:DUF6402 family protein n=1 Tax=Burkholderia sp. lig30 TaxID=1192124 RepID=UPI000461302C|nr:DUF6402 family protein [Burkholderia sp. lig30]KDB09873.1 hypothetical protein LIG30_1075 [Burkholderia sp. lig30]